MKITTGTKLHCTQLEDRAVPATFFVNTVNDTNDLVPGDGIAEDAAGFISLRAAIQESNALGGYNDIQFDFSGDFTIALLSPMTTITGQLSIQATQESKGTITRDLNSAMYDGLFETGNSSYVTLSYLKFYQGNNANAAGGAILNTGLLSLNNVEFIENTSPQGGAIYSEGIISMNYCNFSRNSSSDGGGAVSTTKNITIANSLFEYNTTGYGQKGGALQLMGLINNYHITGTTFTNNTGSEGGAVYSSGGNLYISGCIFSHNFSDFGGDGGAIYGDGAFFIGNTTFEKNIAERNGGAIFWKSSNTTQLTIDTCYFSDNVKGFGFAGADVAYSGIFNVVVINTINVIVEPKI